MKRLLFTAAMMVMLPSCYHATIETGLTPSATTITDRWADAWIAGLVEPSAVETLQGCPNGVARVETQLSFANQLVSFLTFGIYSPMEIVVTCAAGEEDDGVDVVRDADEFAKALKEGDAFYVGVDDS